MAIARRLGSAIAVLLCASAAVAGAAPAAPPPPAWTVGSQWRFTITDLARKAPQVVTLLVTKEKAHSCLGGEWLRLQRVGGAFDNLSEPAWMLRGNELTVLLASDVCDRYDRIEGKPVASGFSGPHTLYGIDGSDDLGTARAVRVK
jgi:hypothetical protein